MTAAGPEPRAVASPMRPAALAYIFVVVLLDMMALGIVLPVLPRLVESFTGGNTVRAAEIYGLFGAAWALMQFIVSPMMGALSDRYGRRPVILISNIGLALDYVLMALAPTLIWLFIGRVISGICAASISTAMAYIADVTPPEQRAKNFGLIGAAFGVGFILGPAVGGVLGAIDLRLPFWAAAAATLANACYGIFILPESLRREHRTSAILLRRANPIGALGLLRSHRELPGLATAYFISMFAHVVLQSVFVLYAGYRYGWDENAVGMSLALVGVCSLIVQVGLVGRMVAWVGERGALATGFGFGAVGLAIYGFAPSGAIFLIGIPVMSLWGLGGPALHSLMSRRVGVSEQGQLQGANNSLMGIANMIGPIVFAGIFAYSIGAGRDWNLPGAAFYVAAVLLIAAAAVAWRATRLPAAP
ncbi:MAG: MFS transporter [Rhizobiales bacterium]|nr:MFS transporter [Hyphomicrobiales bacterium]